jgi:hypothetical protein
LGGVPIIVDIPPKLEAYAILSMTQSEKFLTFLVDIFMFETTAITETAIGNIIMVVAVLLSHMLIKPVEKINPSNILLPPVPVKRMIFNAILLCRFHFSMPSPIMNPPMKRKITSFEYEIATSENLEMPSKGNITNGNNATTGIGIASVIHHTIIIAATARTLHGVGANASGLIQKK